MSKPVVPTRRGRVWVYVRVSKIDQAVNGYSLDVVQPQQARDYFDSVLAREGYVWAGEPFVERGVRASIALTHRPQGMRLSAAVSDGDVVIFTKLDRAFRDTIDCLTMVNAWRQRGVRVVFLDMQIDTATAVGEMVLSVLASFARMERRRIGERSKEGLEAARASGKHIGHPPWGSKLVGPHKGKYLVIYRPEYEIGVKVMKWLGEGQQDVDIYRHLLRHKVTRPPKAEEIGKVRAKKRDWSLQAIQRIPQQMERLLLLVREGTVKVGDGTLIESEVSEVKGGAL